VTDIVTLGEPNTKPVEPIEQAAPEVAAIPPPEDSIEQLNAVKGIFWNDLIF